MHQSKKHVHKQLDKIITKIPISFLTIHLVITKNYKLNKD